MEDYNDSLTFEEYVRRYLSYDGGPYNLELNAEDVEKIYLLSQASGLEIGPLTGQLVHEALVNINIEATVELAKEKKQMVKESKSVKAVKGENKMATKKVSFYDWAQEAKGYRGLQGKVITSVKDAGFSKRLKTKESIFARLLESVDMPETTLAKVFDNLWAAYEGSAKRVRKVQAVQDAPKVTKKRGRPPKAKTVEEERERTSAGYPVELLVDDVLIPINGTALPLEG